MVAEEADARAQRVATGPLGYRAGAPDHAQAVRIATFDAPIAHHSANEGAVAHGAPSADARRTAHQARDRKGVYRAHRRDGMASIVHIDTRIAGAKRGIRYHKPCGYIDGDQYFRWL